MTSTAPFVRRLEISSRISLSSSAFLWMVWKGEGARGGGQDEKGSRYPCLRTSDVHFSAPAPCHISQKGLRQPPTCCAEGG